MKYFVLNVKMFFVYKFCIKVNITKLCDHVSKCMVFPIPVEITWGHQKYIRGRGWITLV